MANYGPNAWYVNYGDGSTTGYFSLAKWTTGTKAAGILIRPFTAQAVGSERAYVSIVGGAAGASEPGTWTATKGATVVDNAVTWQECTGQPAVNGDDGTASGAHGTTSATTAAGSAVLTFSSTPAQVAIGQLIIDKTTAAIIPAKTTVIAFTSTTVTMSANAAGAGVGNGDTIAFSNTPQWIDQGASTAVSLGQIIQDKTGAHLFEVFTAGNTGTSEPTWNTTTGVTTADNAGGGTAVWTCIGATGAFGAWAAPHARLLNAFTANWGAAGNTFFVGDNHAETQSVTFQLAFNQSLFTAPSYVYCADHTVVPPASANRKTTATLTQTGNAVFNCLTGQPGSMLIDGLQFIQSPGANAQPLNIGTTNGAFVLNNCQLKQNASTGGAQIAFSSTGIGSILLNNTTMTFANAGAGIQVRGRVRWQNTASAILGSAPTSFISPLGAGVFTIDGVDLSALAGSSTLVAGNSNSHSTQILNCELGSAVTVASTPTGIGQVIDLIVSDSAAANYRQERYSFAGSLKNETTIIRTSGASDGVTGLSWNITTTANAVWAFPFEAFPVSIWSNATVANVSVTLHGTYKGTTLPLDDQIWIETEYLGNSSFPIASLTTETKSSALASGTALSADTTSNWSSQAGSYQTAYAYGAFTGIIKAGNASPQQIWFMSTHSGTGTSGSDATIFNGQADGAKVTDNSGANQIVWQAFTRFSLTVTLSAPQPQLVGYLRATVKAAAATQTYYVDPLINLS